MKRNISIFLIFYIRIFATTSVPAVLSGLSAASYTLAGAIHFFLTPFSTYFIYHLYRPREYYFYYNLGMSKRFLWCTTLIISGLTSFIISIL